MLRITIGSNKNSGHCDEELHALAASTLTLASMTGEIMTLLADIRQGTVSMRPLFLADAELEENSRVVKAFDSKMQGMVMATFGNLEKYQLSGWEELLGGGGDPQ